MNHHEELCFHLRHNSLIVAVIAFAACGAAVASFFGLRALMATDGFEAWFIPLISASVIGAGLYGVWHKVVHVVPMLRDPGKRVLGTAIAGLLCIATIAISSWFIATSIGGDQAVRQHMASSIAAYEAQLRRAYDNALMEAGLIPDVLRLEAELSALAEEERRTGSLSGQVGAGEVVSTLTRAASGYLDLAGEMEAAQQEVARLHQKGMELIGEMQTQVSTEEGNNHDRQRQFAAAVVALQGVLTEIVQASRIDNVSRHGIVIVETTTATSAQRIAIKNISTTMHELTERLTDEAERIRDNQILLEPITFMPQNPGMATWMYAGDVIGAWVVGIGIDTLPLILLLLLMLGHAEARQPYRERTPFTIVEGLKDAS